MLGVGNAEQASFWKDSEPPICPQDEINQGEKWKFSYYGVSTPTRTYSTLLVKTERKNDRQENTANKHKSLVCIVSYWHILHSFE